MLMNTLIEVINMKDKYFKPFVEVILINDEDVIRTSNNGGESISTGEDELPVMPF